MLGYHFFCVTEIMDYLRNGARLEVVQQMANHERLRTPVCMTSATIKCHSMKSK
jgi:hypothetical protein